MFRFTIRDVLWLTALVAMGVGWWLQAQKTKTLDRRLRGLHEIINANGLIEIQQTAPDKYFVKDGPVTEYLRKIEAKSRAASKPIQQPSPSPDEN